VEKDGMAQDAEGSRSGLGLPAGEKDRGSEPATVIVAADPIFFTSSACGTALVRPKPLTSVFRTLGSVDAKLPGR
jgi:hypothetical protein